MKICFLITGLGIGGAEKHLLSLVPNLRFEKFIISLTSNNAIGLEIANKGVKINYLGLTKFNLPLILLRFRKIIKKEKPDIIDTYLIHSNLFGRIFGRLFGVKNIISFVRSDYSDFKLLNFLDKITQNFVNLYILNSNALLNYVNKKNHVPLNKIQVIPNGIDLEEIYNELDNEYNVRKEMGLKDNSFVVVCVARLIKDKNLSMLIKAMKLVNKNIYLLIVGDGPERKKLYNLTKKLNLKEKIFFFGKRKDVLNIINSANVFILPSIREGSSYALLEAMALKKICIVSNISQNMELIRDGVNGIVFNLMNIKDLAKKIMQVYKNKKFASLKQEAFNLIKKKYNINKLVTKYEKMIELILNIHN